MKKLLTFLIITLMIQSSAFAAYEWRRGTGNTATPAETPKGDTLLNDLDTEIDRYIVQPIDRLLKTERVNSKLTYTSASSVTVADGAVACQNSAGTITKMRYNASSTVATWSDLDTGAEANNTYYVYANCDADADTFTVTISLSSSAPSGVTSFKRLGSFVNSGGDILNDETITNDNDFYGRQLGDWSSKSYNTNYQASTDGFLCARASCNDPSYSNLYGYTDSSAAPTTLRVASSCNRSESVGHSARVAGFCMPVKTGDYYKATNTTSGSVSKSLYWLPNE